MEENNLKKQIWGFIDQNKEMFVEIAKKIWEKPELGLQEFFASELQMKVLKENGFKVKNNIAEMPTAFVAEYGSGKPIIGILGEYDALPGLSQKVKAQREPVEEGAPGHGCGHNLFGTAGVAAAIAIKNAIEEGKLSGTIRYYGCPAEETLVGKVFMARGGVFNDLDVALTWHPMILNAIWSSSSLAMISVRFEFHGIPAHAAASPEQGRSALDAVELMDVAANYLREHVPEKVRIHYSILYGGREPNIVPDRAVVWYYVRAPDPQLVEMVFERLKKIAEGAALMTETEVQWRVLTGCYNFLPNFTLSEVVLKNMKELGGPEFSEDDIQFAKELEKTLPDKISVLRAMGVPEELIKEFKDVSLHQSVIEEFFDKGKVMPGSTDVGDVSWIVPLAQFTTACWALGTPSHSWQATAASGSGIGFNGMIFAAKILAGAIVDIFQNPEIIEKAKEEFKEATGGREYKCLVPEGTEPPFDQFEH